MLVLSIRYAGPTANDGHAFPLRVRHPAASAWAVADALHSSDPSSRRALLVDALLATGREDRTAFARLYRMTSAKLYGICLRICGEQAAAEDVLSDVYLTVWRRAGAFEPGRASPITWLATIARNRAIDWVRAAPNRRGASLEEAFELPDTAPNAEANSIAADDERRLHLCLDALDPKARTAIKTAFFNGVTYAELAEKTGVPLGTMKSWVRRGLARLKDCLNDDR